MNQFQSWLAENPLLASIITAVLILVVGVFVVKYLTQIMVTSLHKAKKFNDLLIALAENAMEKVGYIFVIVLALSKLGIDVGPLIAGIGVTGFIIGFAFKEALGSFASGIMIAITEPFKIDDVVEVDGTLGKVKHLSMIATTLHTPDNKKVIIPNGNAWGQKIINYTSLEQRRVDMKVGISYESDINKAREVIMGVLKKNELILEDPAPLVELVEMADSSVNFVVRPWCKNADYWTVHFKCQQEIKEALDEADITIPYPQMDIHYKELT